MNVGGAQRFVCAWLRYANLVCKIDSFSGLVPDALVCRSVVVSIIA